MPRLKRLTLDMRSVHDDQSGIDAFWNLEKDNIADKIVASLSQPETEKGIFV